MDWNSVCIIFNFCQCVFPERREKGREEEWGAGKRERERRKERRKVVNEGRKGKKRRKGERKTVLLSI